MKATFAPILAIATVLALLGVHLASAASLSPTRAANPVVASSVDAVAGFVMPLPSAEKPQGTRPAQSCDERPDCARLAAYTLDAMKAWAPVSVQPRPGETLERARKRYIDRRLETPGQAEERYARIGNEIAGVVSDPSEAPVWQDDVKKSRTAILVAAIAFFEGSRFHVAVDDGRVNDRAWRTSAIGKRTMALTGDSDGGWAIGRYQLHVECGGIALTPSGFHTGCSADGYPAIPVATIKSDTRIQTRIALHELRQSIAGGLCGYSGEPGPCPKAQERLDFAARWCATHPF